MNKVKKLVVMLLSCIMVMAMGVTVFAAESPTGESGYLVINIVDSEYDSADEIAAVESMKNDPASVLKDLGIENADSYNLLKVVDVHFTETTEEGADYVTAEEKADQSITSTVSVEGVTASDKVVVLHYKNGAWHSEVCNANNGSITFTLTDGCSPVAFFKYAGSTASGTQKTAPKTGELPIAAGIALVIALAATGMMITRKKAL